MFNVSGGIEALENHKMSDAVVVVDVWPVETLDCFRPLAPDHVVEKRAVDALAVANVTEKTAGPVIFVLQIALR